MIARDLASLLPCVLAALSCRADPSVGPPVELERALSRVLPPSGYGVSPPTYEAGTYAVSGAREFDADVDCIEYRRWVKAQFASDWHAADQGDDATALTRLDTGDQYIVTVTCVSLTRPVHVRATALAMPD